MQFFSMHWHIPGYVSACVYIVLDYLVTTEEDLSLNSLLNKLSTAFQLSYAAIAFSTADGCNLNDKARCGFL